MSEKSVEDIIGPLRKHLENDGELVCARGHDRVVAFLIDYNRQDLPRYAVVTEDAHGQGDRGVVIQGAFALLSEMGRHGNPADWRLIGGRVGPDG